MMKFLTLKTILSALLLSCVLLLQTHAFAAENQTTLNFKNADIRNVIEAVSKATGKNFIIDPRVSGKVSMVSSSKMSPDLLYSTFLSILKIHGFIAVNLGNNLFKVVPATEARTEAIIQPSSHTPHDEVLMEIIEIKHVAATALIPILRPLISRNGHLAAHSDSNNIIISDTKSNIDKLHAIIAKIDHANESELKIIKLRYADATKLATILSNVSGKKGAQKGAKKKVSIVAEERTNSLLIRASKSQIANLANLVRTLDTKSSNRSGVSVVKLNHSKAKNIADVLNKMIGSRKEKNAASESKTQVSVDEQANAVVLVGSPNIVAEFKRIIHKLDIKRSQIMVEALIVEMNADKSTQLGIQWSAFPSSVSNPNLPAGGLGSIIGTIRTGGLVSFNVLAEALATDADANLVSAPSILTIENEEATIEVGREVPFVTGSYTSTGSGSTSPSNPFQTITRDNVGLKLKITPQITANNIIKLDIEQEISNLLPGAKASAGAADVITSKRSIKTKVLVKNNHMIVLGGLIDDNVRESESGTPGLRKIPILGALFRHRGTSKEKRNLMIFIRPFIVGTENNQQKVTANRYNYIRNLQLQKSKQGVRLLPGAKQPLLRDLYNNGNPTVTARPRTAPRRSGPMNKWFKTHSTPSNTDDLLNGKF